MKKVTVLLAAAMLTLSVGAANAQKLAHMNYEEVLAEMPETKKATAELENYSKMKEAELKKLGESFQSEVQKYQAEGAKMTEAKRSAKEQELQKTQQNLQQMQNTAMQDINKRRETQ